MFEEARKNCYNNNSHRELVRRIIEHVSQDNFVLSYTNTICSEIHSTQIEESCKC